MAIVFLEKIVSGTVSAGGQNEYGVEAIAFCDGGETQDDVLVAACSDTVTFPEMRSINLPSGATSTFIRETIRIVPMETGDADGKPERFEVSVPYVILGRSQEPYITGDFSTGFSVGMQSQHLMVSKATYDKQTTRDGGVPPDHDRAIGVTDDGIQGVDADFPTFIWTETRYFSDAHVTTDFINSVYAVAIAPLNNAPFRNFAAYEVKFLGLEGSRRHKGGDWELTFRFAAAPNYTALPVGNTLTVAKRGWDYVWVYFTETVDPTLKAKVIRVVDVYVEQIYDSSDFAGLGIGTT
ncbi:MAG TPA: hypothetical protein VH253_06345 [Phycisphaerae bacterium]|nr:hypothetical protein [Phycisphaerae bacterium]